MKAIVGLGNPGRSYARTRHNLGFRVVDHLAEIVRADVRRREADALVGEADVDGTLVLLVKPQTYMNRSGRAVADLLRRYEIPRADLLVVLDDVALPLGTIRLRRQGSAGGHRGLESVIEALGSSAFPRLRLGIRPASPISDMVEFVLSPFAPEEEPIVQEMIRRAAHAALLWVREGIERAMTRFNARSETCSPQSEALEGGSEPSSVGGRPTQQERDHVSAPQGARYEAESPRDRVSVWGDLRVSR